MAKIIQTKKSKVGANPNPELIISADNSYHSYSFFPTTQVKTHTGKKSAPNTITYHYVQEEVKKTSLVTFFLILASIALYTIIQLKIINVSFFGY